MNPSRTTRLLLLALSTFVLFMSTSVGAPVLPELAAELGAGSCATAVILSSALSTVVLFQFFTGGLADRCGRRLVLGSAALAGGLTSLCCALGGDWRWLPFVLAAQPGVLLACVGLALARSRPWLVVWHALFGLAGGTTFLLGLVMAADVIPAGDASGMLGAFDAAVGLLVAVSPAIPVAVHVRLGQVSPLILGAGLVSVVAFPVALKVRETRAAGGSPADRSGTASRGLATSEVAGEALE